ncbi:inositol monophosphatase [Mangrovactinospora gilvigrisea]|uniref:Inositol-1-monophosphatase n=1 Tax=Mangrovactinospora gilvigrisea TaxID=1428644 RepID=A0A1J7C979_9ACTN|nr:inositol monophosphatase family protein [Mangrovactinospora gilvigrisea]OIV36194.1 inositol monophosphatase [Mangrovactinospora gilvigrisea]
MPAPARPDPDELLAVALDAARRAGALLRDGRPDDLGVDHTKSSPTDVVTEMDIAAEKLLVQEISALRPDDGFLGEEGASREGTSGVRWVVDPLDGTVNYLYGLPEWAVSVAAEDADGTVVGVVEVPMRGEVFRAVRGRGAFLTGPDGKERRLAVRPAPRLDRALVATGFGYLRERRNRQAAVARTLIPRVRDIRRGGSAAIDLSDVAAGRLDAHYERGLNPWDLAAGVLIAREAGARAGGRRVPEPDAEFALTSAPGLYDQLHDTLDELGAWHD